MSIFRALYAETLKLKRTLAVWMIFVLPLLVATLEFLAVSQGTHSTPDV